MATGFKTRLSEADVAKIAIRWLTSQGWEIYQEVPCQSGRCDIVAVRTSLVWIVETKVSLTADLMLQCRARLKEFVTGVVACYSGTRWHRGGLHPLVEWGIGKGIGALSINGVGESCDVIAWPAIRRISTDLFLRNIRPEQKTFAEAGTNGRYWTRFKNLVEELQEHLVDGWTLRDACEQLTCMSQYKERRIPAQARALADYLQRDLIPGWSIEKRETDGRMVIRKVEAAP